MALKKATKRITWTDESINDRGFWVLNSGVSIADYEKNPILLFNHIRPFSSDKDQVLPIGVMLELRQEPDGSWSGLPAFDDTDAFALSIYEKYEAGILNMSSAGLQPKEVKDKGEFLKNNAPCLSKSVLKEISICDIASNSNAVKLYSADNTEIKLNSSTELIQLFNNSQNNNMDLIQLAAKLQLPETATMQDVAAKIEQLQSDFTAANAAKQAAEADVIKLTAKVTDMETAATQAKIDALVDGAVATKKITAVEATGYKKLAAADYDSVAALLEGKQGYTPIQQQLAAAEGGDVNRAELAELIKLSGSDLFTQGKLDRLKELDPVQFKLKYKEAFGTEPKTN